jgi:Uma2 family endonuclease
VHEDVLAAPPHVIAEVVQGVLHTQPRPAMPHTRAASRLGGELGGPFDRGRGGPGGWIVLHEPELHLGEDIVVADLAGWRRQRLPKVLSPSTQAFDRADKLDVHAKAGVQNAWIVDPLAKLREVYRLEREKWVRLGTWAGEAMVRAEPFEAFELELGALWAE